MTYIEIKAWNEWLSFCRRHIQMYFPEWKKRILMTIVSKKSIVPICLNIISKELVQRIAWRLRGNKIHQGCMLADGYRRHYASMSYTTRLYNYIDGVVVTLQLMLYMPQETLVTLIIWWIMLNMPVVCYIIFSQQSMHAYIFYIQNSM